MSAIQDRDLAAELEPLINTYETIGERDRFLWKWVYSLVPRFTFSCVAPEYAERVRTIKTAATLFTTLLDDCVEKHRDRRTFQEGAKIPFTHRSVNLHRDGIDNEYIDVIKTVWQWLERQLNESPRLTEFDDWLYYDLKQVINAVEYSDLVNQDLEAARFDELDTYDSHNMMMFVYADIDFMYSPSFDRTELAQLRAIVADAQQMARIGNWVSTWERELREQDYSSGVILYALESGVVTQDELLKLESDCSHAEYEHVIESIRDHDIERRLLEKWDYHYARVEQMGDQVESIDTTAYLDGMEDVLDYHLASRGMK